MKAQPQVLQNNEAVYAQRRRIIDLIYEARHIIGSRLPWIKVRIVDFGNSRNSGMCYINQNHIVISHKLATWSQEALRRTVWHELAHAYFRARHDPACPLMSPVRPAVIPPVEELSEALKRLSAGV